MKVSKSRMPKSLLRNFITALALLGSLAFIMYQVTGSINTVLFVNKTDEKEVIAFRYTNPHIPFTCSDRTVNVSGQRVVYLNLSSQTQTYSLYSESLNSSEIRDVGVLTLNGKEFPVLWRSVVDDGKERIIYGKFVDFYRFGTKESVPVLVVEDFREPDVLDQVVSMNKLTFFHIAVLFIILTATISLALLGLVLWFVAKLE